MEVARDDLCGTSTVQVECLLAWKYGEVAIDRCDGVCCVGCRGKLARSFGEAVGSSGTRESGGKVMAVAWEIN